MADRRFILSKGPHLRKSDFPKVYGTGVMMRDLFISLIPLVLFAWLKNGLFPYIGGFDDNFYNVLRPLIMVIVGAGTSYLTEVGYFALFMKEKNPFKKSFKSYSIIPGLLLSMILPLYTPIWVLIIGAIFGEVFGKMIFGGFGYNIFNPALIGYVFVITAFYGAITSNGGYLNPAEVITGATPLADFKSVLDGTKSLDALLNTQGSLFDFFIGNVSGSMAETSGMLIVVAAIFLIMNGVIDWKTPVCYVATVFVFSYICGAFLGYASTLKFALFNILSGGVLFGAVFMVTEPVTSPRDPLAKVFYAMLMGLLTIMLRYLTGFNEGVATSILFMNMFTPILDIKCAQLRVADKPKTKVIGYGVIAVISIAIVLYTVLSVVGVGK